MVTQLEEIQRQMRDALVVCKAAVEENNANLVTDYSLNIEPEFRDFKKLLTTPEVEKPKDSKQNITQGGHQGSHFYFLAFNDSQSGYKDSYKTSQPAAFEDSFNNKAGFDDDSWQGGNSWNTHSHDAFGGNSKPDPFGASHVSPAKDVSLIMSPLLVCSHYNYFSINSLARTLLAAIHSLSFMHQHKDQAHKLRNHHHQHCHRRKQSNHHHDPLHQGQLKDQK